MNEQYTYRQLLDLRFHGMIELHERFEQNPAIVPDHSRDFFGAMVEAEVHDRRHRKQMRMMKNARFKYSNACLEDFDFSVDRGVSRNFISWLSGFSWLKQQQNIIITGPTGTGKTNTACAIGTNAIRQGYSVLYKRVPRLCEELEVAHGDGSLPSVRAKLQKYNILILDEWAVSPITSRARLDLLEVIEDRVGTGSLVITSQLPVNQWHAYIGDPTLADALLDRVVHRSHQVELKGDSMRKLKESVQEKNYV